MMIGKRISGRYKILEIIGGGGMANVYLAHDMILDRDVAVKMLRLDFANDEEFIRRFHREAQSATSLAHPNIVSIYDVGEEDSLYYIVMEYVDGQTLKQYIQQNSPVRVEKVIEIMKQLTSAIAHAHQNHIIHRDIKPHNILIDKHGNVKITDFGIAMALSATSITQTNSVIGSVHYLSPEQARGGMANRKSDIYSLGIVMFELLTGRLPFSGESAVSIALKHLQSETPSLRRWYPSIPQSVENIVLKATAKDPFHRYDTAEKMEEDLSSALDPERINEEKFMIPVDDDATKAIPIITDEHAFPNRDETVVHGNETKAFHKTGDPKQQKEKKKRKKWPIVLVSTFISLIILGILVVFVLPGLLSTKEITVPDLTGKEIDEAIAELESAGFKVNDPIQLNDAEIKEGLVIKTDPKAGKTVKEGSSIDIYESLGKEKFELADYTGRSYDDVVRQLENEHFKFIDKKEVYDETNNAGIIIDQSLREGEPVIPEETELVFTVSKGPSPITLEDLKGYNEKGLQVYEKSTELIIATTEDYSDDVQEGLVITQDPAPGTQLFKGDKVKVVLSKGKKEIPPKTVTREIIVPYEPSEEGQPQEVQIYIDDLNRDLNVPYSTDYITENKTFTITLTIAQGQQAFYQVRRDGDLIDQQYVPFPSE
ncbi:Stk1 family PASTA domain-containing Ser/Thr kinase [Bacillus sp. S/N-304-OC-R1]|uniref:Stk1 family PASTA domain-containing Ser/Thr kinase n=1 Tax=Bacillus sp. S/N-304-OC-R1 TaxID=2758034 RepID=UPI001C8D7423|nr:Stk1 family PASTA domain-containing Ser/Thr kinase [Bacillus sp. S/N-304-OC-R1]MBY0120745.1 Stk1 family PASTA domain-containing Ser/Thr kinase [Bacillus sp. S/N-304-OC-R1]